MPIEQNQPTILDITYTGNDRYIFRIKKSRDQCPPPLEIEWNIGIKRSILKDLCQEMSQEAQLIDFESNENVDNTSTFKKLGQILYAQVIPEKYQDLREILSNINTPLLISTNDPEPIWELFYIGDDFIATKYIVSRCLRKSASQMFCKNMPSNPPGDLNERRCLIIANPAEDLNETVKETKKLKEWIEERGMKCDSLAGEQVTRKNILIKLSKHNYEIIHYTGHIYCDPQKDKSAFFELSEGHKLSATDVKKSVKGAPLVFLNGCRSASNIKSMADAFLETGSSIVIGTVFKITEVGARMFSEKFYELILEGKPVGMALKEARIKVRDKKIGATWASFIMYGDPCWQLDYSIPDSEPINKFLKELKLSPQNFEPYCLHIIETAISYAQREDLVTTIHLFKAIIKNEERYLYDFLKNQDDEFLKIEKRLRKILKNDCEVRKDTDSLEVKCSLNISEILLLANSIAEKRGCKQIAETDLLSAFIIQGGGTSGQILLNLGLNLEEILGEIPITMPLYTIARSQSNLGSITKDECDPFCWDILAQSIKKALYAGWDKVISPHLFLALLHGKEGCMVETLKKYGVPADKIKRLKQVFNTMIITKGNIFSNKGILEIPCSRNVEQILLKAKELSISKDNDKIKESDLMDAFIRYGGGKTGEILNKLGIDISSNIQPGELF